MVIVVFLCLLILAPFPSSLGLWPIPRGLSAGTATVKLSSSFDIHVAFNNVPADLDDAIHRIKTHLKTDTFERLVVGRGSADANSVHRAFSIKDLTLSLTQNVTIRPVAVEVNTVGIEDRDESYILTIPAKGTQATLVANSTLGLFRGLSTFDFMWYHFDGEKYILNAPLRITDSPAFPYRGFSFDTSRNFYPVSDIKRTLDAMSWVKLNVLYWHIADSQAFPLQVAAFPELAARGAYSQEEIYTESDIKSVVKYANERGIDVVMELDTPGHTTAIGMAHPEHIACFAKSPWTKYANEPPAGQLRIASADTVNFAKKLFQSAIDLLDGTMMSSGGDEVNLPCWNEDEDTLAALEQNNQTIAQALDQFVQEVQGVMNANGKMPFIKSDMVLEHNVTVLNNTGVVVWKSSLDAVSVAQRGLRFIHQPSNYFYLDCGAGDWVGNNVLGNSWCDPFKTWQRAYSFDPYANLTTDQQHLVLGGQMPIWSEQSSSENLDQIVWPRLAAGAEVFWTGATLPDGNPRLGVNATSGVNAFARLNEVRYRLVDRGVKAIALQPKWCALRPGLCDVDS
ncbi:N-acetylhexosaminidase [Cristinia sonorae]|uniref:Beta-hexosaminidase n=1 Tax=Cristinia sonorae TaxID=1940300 RepID=A0A8K0XPB0_9AGAR|nr:N-acetylhexosaminidase [Cristinia sonorae]